MTKKTEIISPRLLHNYSSFGSERSHNESDTNSNCATKRKNNFSSNKSIFELKNTNENNEVEKVDYCSYLIELMEKPFSSLTEINSYNNKGNSNKKCKFKTKIKPINIERISSAGKGLLNMKNLSISNNKNSILKKATISSKSNISKFNSDTSLISNVSKQRLPSIQFSRQSTNKFLDILSKNNKKPPSKYKKRNGKKGSVFGSDIMSLDKFFSMVKHRYISDSTIKLNKLYKINSKFLKEKKKLQKWKEKPMSLEDYQDKLIELNSMNLGRTNMRKLYKSLKILRKDAEVVKPLPSINYPSLIRHSFSPKKNKKRNYDRPWVIGNNAYNNIYKSYNNRYINGDYNENEEKDMSDNNIENENGNEDNEKYNECFDSYSAEMFRILRGRKGAGRRKGEDKDRMKLSLMLPEDVVNAIYDNKAF